MLPASSCLPVRGRRRTASSATDIVTLPLMVCCWVWVSTASWYGSCSLNAWRSTVGKQQWKPYNLPRTCRVYAPFICSATHIHVARRFRLCTSALPQFPRSHVSYPPAVQRLRTCTGTRDRPSQPRTSLSFHYSAQTRILQLNSTVDRCPCPDGPAGGSVLPGGLRRWCSARQEGALQGSTPGALGTRRAERNGPWGPHPVWPQRPNTGTPTRGRGMRGGGGDDRGPGPSLGPRHAVRCGEVVRGR